MCSQEFSDAPEEEGEDAEESSIVIVELGNNANLDSEGDSWEEIRRHSASERIVTGLQWMRLYMNRRWEPRPYYHR